MRVVEYGLEVLFVADQEAEVVVLLLQTLQLGERRSHPELLLQLTAAVLERVVVQEDYVGVGELPPSLLGHLHVHFPDERHIQQPDFVLRDDVLDCLLCALGNAVVGFFAH